MNWIWKKGKDRHNHIQFKLFFRFKSNIYFVFVIFIFILFYFILFQFTLYFNNNFKTNNKYPSWNTIMQTKKTRILEEIAIAQHNIHLTYQELKRERWNEVICNYKSRNNYEDSKSKIYSFLFPFFFLFFWI